MSSIRLNIDNSNYKKHLFLTVLSPLNHIQYNDRNSGNCKRLDIINFVCSIVSYLCFKEFPLGDVKIRTRQGTTDSYTLSKLPIEIVSLTTELLFCHGRTLLIASAEHQEVEGFLKFNVYLSPGFQSRSYPE